MAGRQWMAVLAAAVVGAGAATVAASCGEDDSGVQIEGSSTGGTNTGGTGTGTSTGSVTVDTKATNAEDLDGAMAEITAYARRQAAGLVVATTALQAAVDAGSVPKAKQAYAAGRPTTSASSRSWPCSPSWTARSMPARMTSRRRPRTRPGPDSTR